MYTRITSHDTCAISSSRPISSHPSLCGYMDSKKRQKESISRLSINRGRSPLYILLFAVLEMTVVVSDADIPVSSLWYMAWDGLGRFRQGDVMIR